MTSTSAQPALRPASRLDGVHAYEPPAPRWRIGLRLDANEGPAPDAAVFEAILGCGDGAVCRYPDARGLEADIAASFGVAPGRVVVTNGGDDAIDRLCRAVLEPGRDLLTHTPTFVMISRSARLAGAGVRTVEWTDGPFPEATLAEAIDPGVGLVALVSPNNPTGGVVGLDVMTRIASRSRVVGAVVLADLAYVEFAGVDPTPGLLGLDNVVVVRTFSKAFGLAGLRVGYAVAPEPVAAWLRAAGGPYPVSGVSLAAARVVRGRGPNGRYLDVVRSQRASLAGLCAACGLPTLPSEANFVTIRSERSPWIRDALGSLGVSVRLLEPDASPALCRVTLPGARGAFEQLCASLEAAASPGAVLFDLDGVLADVSASYRRAIVETAAAFGVVVTTGEITAAKAGGNANNDWALTQRLLAAHGVDASLDDVTRVFQRAYLGDAGRPGLREGERLIPPASLLCSLRSRAPLGIVTGRPREEAEWFLERAGVRSCFDVLVAMEDAAAKPAPDGVLLATRTLGVASAWMVGDTPDDVTAARAAGVVPIGVCAPSEPDASASLYRAGAARVLDSLAQLEGLLP